MAIIHELNEKSELVQWHFLLASSDSSYIKRKLIDTGKVSYSAFNTKQQQKQ